MDDFTINLDRNTGIAIARLCRPPHNFLDAFFLGRFCDGLVLVDDDPDCRCVIISSDGRNFSAGRDFSGKRLQGDTSEAVYAQAVRLMALETPIIAAVQGAAVGAGFGLAMIADFRLCSERAYFAANFVEHGLHHGFGLSVTLPFAVGKAVASQMVITGRRYGAAEALSLGVVTAVVEEAVLLDEAMDIASVIAKNPRSAVRSIRSTMRAELRNAFTMSVDNEGRRQSALLAART